MAYMFGKKKDKEKNIREPFNPRKESKLLPGYIIVGIWVFFTIFLLVWILGASFSTAPEIMQGKVFKFESGFHFENYINAWNANSISTFFMNSLLYSVATMVGAVIISAPAAYVLSRFTFLGNKSIKSGFLIAMSIPNIMIVLPLMSISIQLGINGSRGLLIFLYIGMQIPYTTTFLMTFFQNLSRTYEEAAAIDGCTPMMTFWRIMFPLAQPGIITVSIFIFMNIWNEYFISLIFASSSDIMPVGPGLKSVLSSMQYTGDWGGLFAAVVIVFLPTLILYVFLSEKIISGVTGGGIKG